MDHTLRLTSYLRHLARHSKIKQDQNFLNFLQDVEMAKPDITYDLKKVVGDAVKKAMLIKDK